MPRSILIRLASATLIATLGTATRAATPADLQAAYSALSATTAVADRGQQLFANRHAPLCQWISRRRTSSGRLENQVRHRP